MAWKRLLFLHTFGVLRLHASKMPPSFYCENTFSAAAIRAPVSAPWQPQG
jgi:hypothetical protein